jgi:hypothetical protein
VTELHHLDNISCHTPVSLRLPKCLSGGALPKPLALVVRPLLKIDCKNLSYCSVWKFAGQKATVINIVHDAYSIKELGLLQQLIAFYAYLYPEPEGFAALP